MTQLLDNPTRIAEQALAEVAQAKSEVELEQLRIAYLGRTSEFMTIPKGFAALPAEQRAGAGKAFNQARTMIDQALTERAAELAVGKQPASEPLDVTFPGIAPQIGRLHVLTQVQREVEVLMEGMGYAIEVGPEVETDWYNFEALNLPRGHASRDMQETLFMSESEELVLRTHTSPMQIRCMQKYQNPPIYVAMPGRVYRRENIDATHGFQFMQIEALAIDEGITVGDLKGTVQYFAQALWGTERRVQFRPSFFPYTEPSFEFDVSCGICQGRGCRSCGSIGWLEVGGCGMVHPNVLRNGGLNPETCSGFAWGFGIERIAMLKYDIHDLRLFYDNDLRFLEQF
ncbi:MAG: phenylalanine--tRNA ligase subunit alpha [Candidatus Dormibacteraceae bacterium]